MTTETESPTASLGAARIVYEVPVCNGRPAGTMSIDCTAIDLHAERPPLVRAQIEGGGAVIISWHRVIRIESRAATALRASDEAAHDKSRTAEAERRDVLLTLDRLAAEKERKGCEHPDGTLARSAFTAAAAALRMAYEVIERGDHKGTAER